MQICAVLAAVTEVIRSQGGKETETEYFAALVSVYDGAACSEQQVSQAVKRKPVPLACQGRATSSG